MIDLPAHSIELALIEPRIAPNTGNIARLCAATGTALHLVRPLGFVLTDRQLRRSGMDYWQHVRLTIHDDLTAFRAAAASRRMWLFSSKATRGLWEADFADGDWLVFGNETHGLPETLLSEQADRMVRIPQIAGQRCLNLATAAGIGLYEALRGCRLRS